MESKLTNKGHSIYEIEATVDKENWKAAQDRALKKLASRITIKGFRTGKAPIQLAKERINPSDLINEAINQALPECYNKALNEHKIRPFTNPDVNVTKLDDNGFTVVFTITSVPEVTLGQYKDINIPLETKTATKKDVEEQIEHVLEDNAELVLKEGPAEKGDTVVFDFKGYVDGKEFEGGSADNYSLVLGSNQFIPGFEDQLVGVTSETKKDVLVTFPEQYVKDLAGKDAKFVCMIHEIKTKQKPELNDEFVSTLNLNNVKTVEEFKEYEKNVVQQRLDNAAKQEQFNKILAQIISNAKVEIADKVLEQEAEQIKKDDIAQIEQNGLTFEQYKEIIGKNDDELHEIYLSHAKQRLTQYLVFNKIGEVENLIVSRKELDDYFNQLASNYNMNVEDVKKMYKGNESRIMNSLLENKIVRFITANNTEEMKEDEKVSENKETEEKPAKKTTTRAKKSTGTTSKKTTKTTKKETSEESK